MCLKNSKVFYVCVLVVQCCLVASKLFRTSVPWSAKFYLFIFIVARNQIEHMAEITVKESQFLLFLSLPITNERTFL